MNAASAITITSLAAPSMPVVITARLIPTIGSAYSRTVTFQLGVGAVIPVVALRSLQQQHLTAAVASRHGPRRAHSTHLVEAMTISVS